ncbi:MAG: DUF2029 domain-containing protein [Anaerolineae bacterium]|nr:DUF2029 domain-containing protein [Anaerolineae bacterium]
MFFRNKSAIVNYLIKFEEVVWWALAIGIVIGLSLIIDQADIIGRDWQTLYRPATLSDDFIHYEMVANPPYIMFIFYPLALFTPLVGYVGLMIVSVICFRLTAHLSSFNKWLIFPSFPAFWMLVYGQIDGLVTLGVAIGAWSIRRNKPYFQGVATLLLCLKPHIGAILALVYLLWQWNWRAFVVSISVCLLSLYFFGVGWPIEWLNRLFFETNLASQEQGFSRDANSFNNIGLFPYGLLAWLLVLIPYPKSEKIPAIVSASILSSPYAGGYSLLSTMGVPLPLFIYPLLSLPFLGAIGYKFLIVAPIALVVWPVIKHYGLPLFYKGKVDQKARIQSD